MKTLSTILMCAVLFSAIAIEVPPAKPAPFGYCPICGARGKWREKRPNGNDHCENGHIYPSKDAVNKP